MGLLAFGIMLLLVGVIGGVVDWPMGTAVGSFTASVGVMWIAMAGFDVARPSADRFAVLIYRAAYFLVPVGAATAYVLADF